MIGILISLLVLVLVFGIAWWIITLLPLPAPFGQIAQVLLLLILLLVLVAWLLPLAGIPHAWGTR